MSRNSALSVANKFIEKGGQNGGLTLLQVIKLTYLAQGWMLGLYGRRLFHQDVEAWRYGPVVADVWYALKHYGRNPVKEIVAGVPEGNFDELEADLIEQVYAEYGGLSGIQLSSLTHQPDTPWDKCPIKGRGCVIPIDSIQAHFEAKAADK